MEEGNIFLLFYQILLSAFSLGVMGINLVPWAQGR